MRAMAPANPPLSEAEKLEFGSSNSCIISNPGLRQLVIASYNIRYARGSRLISGGLVRKLGITHSHGRKDVVAKNIEEAAIAFENGKLLPRVHVLAMQEADKGTRRCGGHHIAKELANKLRMSWIHAPAGLPRGTKPQKRQWWLDFEEPIDLFDEGDTGVALLSRLPLSDATRIDLPWHECPWRPRLAMAATIDLAGGRIRLFNVHVDPHASPNGQLEQLETIVSHTKAYDLPTLILGDFNTLSARKRTETRTYLESQGFSSALPTGTATWRGAGIHLHADWIFSKKAAVKKWGVARPLSVSDHWPIWAQVEIA